MEAFDKNKNGKIDFNDFMRGIKEYNVPIFQDTQIHAVFKQLSIDDTYIG